MCDVLKLPFCTCNPPLFVEELPYSPPSNSPLDKVGIYQRCCWCFSVRTGAIVICMISFLWGLIEFLYADRYMRRMVETNTDVFYYGKLIYMLWSAIFVIISGLLMLGLIINFPKLLHIYIWYAIVYCAVNLLLGLLPFVVMACYKQEIPKIAAFKILVNVLWSVAFIYFLVAVNSYKFLLWYHGLL